MSNTTRRAWINVPIASADASNEVKVVDAPMTASAKGSNSLHALAQSKGMMGFGSVIHLRDKGFVDIVLRDCGIVTVQAYWGISPNPQDFEFYQSDRRVSWAEQNGMKIRGHNLLWPRLNRNPEWLVNYDFGTRPATEAERILRYHISTVCKRYGTRIFTWDVVNEAINPRTGKVRDEMVFGKYLGEAMIDIAFDAAHQAAPQAQLVYNDFMEWSAANAPQREGVLKLLDRLKSRNVPVHVLGVQGHIGTVGPGNLDNVKGTQTFSAREEAAWRSFLDSVVAMGYPFAITEFDVSEIGTPSDIPTRDRGMADLTRRSLDVMMSYPQFQYMVCWGLVDHHSWLQSRALRHDGMLKRPCPYDDNYQPKLMYKAIADAMRAAPVREPYKF